MLTNARVSRIQQLRGTTHFSIQFIRDFDKEWDAVVYQLRSSGVNLAKIRIVPKHVEYRNVRT